MKNKLKDKIEDIYYPISRTIRDWKYSISCFFFPRHDTLRKSIPREWRDSDEVFRIMNFTLITEFVEEELNGGNDLNDKINWYDDKIINFKIDNINNFNELELNQYKIWRDFYVWLRKAYWYIKSERPKLEFDLDNAYPELGKNPLDEINSNNFSYEEKYGEVNRIEKLIKDNDTKILKEIVDYRDGLWT